MSFFPDESFDAVIDKGNEIALSLVLFRIIFHSLTSFSHLHSNLLWDRPVITVTGTLDSLMVSCILFSLSNLFKFIGCVS